MSAFLRPLSGVAGILLVSSAAGWMLARAFLPEGKPWRAERLGWSVLLGSVLLALFVAVSFSGTGHPGWLPFLLLAAGGAALSRVFPVRAADTRLASPDGDTEGSAARVLLTLLLAGGVLLYALAALTEPMWSNDYVAIWGLKGKTFFGEGGIPGRLFLWQSLAFSHPEYPLGLPLLYAGVAFLLGRFDDHALALLFPVWQMATLVVLFGFLRRRGVSRSLALTAAALLAHFGPLYSGFLTGMAEVPLSFAMLLFGTAFCDALSGSPGAPRRLAIASAAAAAIKNEGFFLAVAAFVVLLLAARKETFSRTVAATLLPAGAVRLIQRLAFGAQPLRDFDFGLFAPSSWGDLAGRLGESLGTAASEVLLPAWPGLLALAVVIAAGSRSRCGGLLLLLAGLGAALYLCVPAVAVAGPSWLVRTALARTLAALAPLVATAVALRLRKVWEPLAVGS
jgi:hypothetical protein